MGSFKTASLDPDTFRHQMPDPPVGKIQIVQRDHDLQVRGIAELHVPCACGRPLVAIEHEWIHDARGSALYVQGVCLSCGIGQTAIYLSEPALSEKDHETRFQARLRADVDRVVNEVLKLTGVPILAVIDEIEENPAQLKETT